MRIVVDGNVYSGAATPKIISTPPWTGVARHQTRPRSSRLAAAYSRAGVIAHSGVEQRSTKARADARPIFLSCGFGRGLPRRGADKPLILQKWCLAVESFNLTDSNGPIGPFSITSDILLWWVHKDSNLGPAD